METLVQKKWNEILDFIKNEYGISNVSYKTWISNLYVKKVEDNIVYITSDDNNITDNFNHINSKYGIFIQTAINELTDGEYNIKFDNESEDVKTETIRTIQKVNHNQGLSLNPDYTFDNFVVSKCDGS